MVIWRGLVGSSVSDPLASWELWVERILVALTDGDSPALGSGWRITAKRTDFYLDPIADVETFHLSAHGPNDRYEGHRFHFRVDRKGIEEVRGRGDLLT